MLIQKFLRFFKLAYLNAGVALSVTLGGEIVVHLDEFDIGLKDALKQVGVAAIEVVKNNKGKTAIIVGTVAGVSVAGGIVAHKVNAKRVAKHQEVLAEFQNTMQDYFKAIGSSELTEEIIDRLLNAVIAVKESGICKGKTGAGMVEILDVFMKSVEEYTRELCKANNCRFKVMHASGKQTASKKIDSLYEYLQTQKDVIAEAA